MSGPTSFFHLPLEIREMIYRYTFERQDTDIQLMTYDTDTEQTRLGDTVLVHKRDPYWKNPRSTSLFRVNRQISTEARRLFYSQFIFEFLPWTEFKEQNSVDSISYFPRQLFSPETRPLVKKVRFSLVIFSPVRSAPTGVTESLIKSCHRYRLERRRFIRTFMELLPNIKKIEVVFAVYVHTPTENLEETLGYAMEMVAPLTNKPSLTIRPVDLRDSLLFTAPLATEPLMQEIRKALGLL
ncbi:MAG: hypothetical protein Q9218_002082 [Villophora microphyllina]